MSDTALETFEVAIERAKYLLKLYHGLVNMRKRSVRSDWAEKFNVLMHWPKRSRIHRVDSRSVVIVTRPNADLVASDFSEEQLTDLLRASIVMGVAALDAYFHAKILAHVVQCAKKGTSMPGALAKASMTVKDFVGARQYKRKMTVVRNALKRTLGYQSLQQPENISHALALIGVSKFWDRVATRLEKDAGEVRKKLGSLIKRRNQIAHEADLSQSRRARNKPHRLLPSYVGKSLEFLKQLVQQSDREINVQLGRS